MGTAERDEKVTSLLKELKQKLTELYGKNLSGLYLYGSYARHEEDFQSDIDIAIILNDFQDYWEEIQRTSHIISDLSLKCGITLSPVRIRKREWSKGDSPFLNNLRKESIAL